MHHLVGRLNGILAHLLLVVLWQVLVHRLDRLLLLDVTDGLRRVLVDRLLREGVLEVLSGLDRRLAHDGLRERVLRGLESRKVAGLHHGEVVLRECLHRTEDLALSNGLHSLRRSSNAGVGHVGTKLLGLHSHHVRTIESSKTTLRATGAARATRSKSTKATHRASGTSGASHHGLRHGNGEEGANQQDGAHGWVVQSRRKE